MMRFVFLLAAATAGLVLGAALSLFVDRLYPGITPPGRGASPWRTRLLLLSTATALLFGAAALRATEPRQFVLMCLFGAALLVLTATDFERRLLPNRMMYPSLIAAALLSWSWPHHPWWSGLAGGLAGSMLMLLIFMLFPGFGFGDVKLAGLIGLILGFPGVLSGLLTGMILGGIGAAWFVVSRRGGLRSVMAYGPYLAGGAILEMFLRR